MKVFHLDDADKNNSKDTITITVPQLISLINELEMVLKGQVIVEKNNHNLLLFVNILLTFFNNTNQHLKYPFGTNLRFYL